MASETTGALEALRVGTITVNSWTGRVVQRVEIIGETPKKYRIKAIQLMRLPGRNRWLNPGQTALVPKGVVALEAQP